MEKKRAEIFGKVEVQQTEINGLSQRGDGGEKTSGQIQFSFILYSLFYHAESQRC